MANQTLVNNQFEVAVKDALEQCLPYVRECVDIDSDGLAHSIAEASLEEAMEGQRRLGVVLDVLTAWIDAGCLLPSASKISEIRAYPYRIDGRLTPLEVPSQEQPYAAPET